MVVDGTQPPTPFFVLLEDLQDADGLARLLGDLAVKAAEGPSAEFIVPVPPGQEFLRLPDNRDLWTDEQQRWQKGPQSVVIVNDGPALDRPEILNAPGCTYYVGFVGSPAPHPRLPPPRFRLIPGRSPLTVAAAVMHDFSRDSTPGPLLFDRDEAFRMEELVGSPEIADEASSGESAVSPRFAGEYSHAAESLAEDPGRLELNRGYADLYLARYDEARRWFEAALAAKYRDPTVVLAEIAETYLQTDQYDEARRMYARLLEEDPTSSEWRMNLGFAQALSGQYENALKSYWHVVEGDPKNARALRSAAVLLVKLNSPTQALLLLERCLELDVADASSRMCKARALIALSDHEAALQALKEAKAASYADSTRLILAYAELWVAWFRWERALKAYRDAYQVAKHQQWDNPDDRLRAFAQARHGEALTLLQLGRTRDAKAVVEEAVALAPREPPVLQLMSRICLELGFFEEAEAFNRRAVSCVDSGREDEAWHMLAGAAEVLVGLGSEHGDDEDYHAALDFGLGVERSWASLDAAAARSVRLISGKGAAVEPPAREREERARVILLRARAELALGRRPEARKLLKRAKRMASSGSAAMIASERALRRVDATDGRLNLPRFVSPITLIATPFLLGGAVALLVDHLLSAATFASLVTVLLALPIVVLALPVLSKLKLGPVEVTVAEVPLGETGFLPLPLLPIWRDRPRRPPTRLSTSDEDVGFPPG